MVCLAPQLFLLVYPHANVGLPTLPPCWESSLPRLPVSAPPTGLDECFFNFLVLRHPYSVIFWQFWLSFVFKFVVLLLVVWGGTVYLPMPPSWLEGFLFILNSLLGNDHFLFGGWIENGPHIAESHDTLGITPWNIPESCGGPGVILFNHFMPFIM